MFRNKPKMFVESEKSTASDNLIVNIFVFIIIMAVIMIAESIIPSILSYDEMQLELGGSTDFVFAMQTAARIGMQPKYFIPTLFCTGFGTIISIIYCRFVEARHIRSMGARREKAVPHYLLGLLIGLVLMTAIVLISVVFRINNLSLCNGINFGMIGLYFLGFLTQGMSEEFIFRGFLMNSLGGKHHPAIAVGVSAAAFSLAHLMNPGFSVLVFINLAMFGVFASLYMIAFDDIWGVCGIHSIWNFTQGSLYGISVSGSGEAESILRTTAASDSVHRLLTGGDFGIEGSLVTTVVLTVAIAIVCIMLNKQESSEKVKPEA